MSMDSSAKTKVSKVFFISIEPAINENSKKTEEERDRQIDKETECKRNSEAKRRANEVRKKLNSKEFNNF